MVRNQRDQGQSEYTQTFSTADRTVANATATIVGNLGNGADGASSSANFDKIEIAIDALIADVDDLRQTVTALIDDLQEAGVVR